MKNNFVPVVDTFLKFYHNELGKIGHTLKSMSVDIHTSKQTENILKSRTKKWEISEMISAHNSVT